MTRSLFADFVETQERIEPYTAGPLEGSSDPLQGCSRRYCLLRGQCLCEEEADYFDPDMTEHYCEECGEDIFLNEPVVVMKLCKPYMDEESVIHYHNVLDEGDIAELEPIFLNEECYENLQQELVEALIDVPPHIESTAALTCDCCGSSVRMGEKISIGVKGRIQRSRRLGDSNTFEEIRVEKGVELSPNVLCLTCTSHVGEALNIEDWSDVSQNNECHGCMKARCWRIGRCMCSCHAKGQ